MNRRHRVLLLTVGFPPDNCVEARRPAAWAKYLPMFGWDPIVVACNPGEPSAMTPEEVRLCTGGLETVTRVDAPARRSLPAFVGKVCVLWELSLLPGAVTRRLASRALRAALAVGEGVDVVLGTYPGAWPLLVAKSLAAKWGCPWVADFRDLPHQLTAMPRFMRKGAVWRVRHLVRDAAHVIADSEGKAAMLRNSRHLVSVIPSGFDPDTIVTARTEIDRGVFRLVYTGTITGGQNVKPVMEAIDSLVKSGQIPADKIEIVFHGTNPSIFAGTSYVKRPTLGAKLSVTEVLQRQRTATALVLLMVPGAAGVFPGKLYEYLAAGRPILSFPADPDGVDRVLTATGAGLSCDNREQLQRIILRWYREWEQDGDIAFAPNAAEINRYNRKDQVQQLAKILDKVVNAQKP